MIELQFVSKNKHKLLEILSLIKTMNADDIIKVVLSPLPKIEIQSNDLVEVVRFAAQYLAEKGYTNFFIEDSGLFIEALNGFPGPYSNFVFKTIGLEGILKLLRGVSNRKAYFMSAIALSFRGEIKVFIGKVEGEISHEKRGKRGFGFDPIFIPIGSNKTFAEMKLEEKNKFSHRAKAVKSMIEYLMQTLTSNFHGNSVANIKNYD